MYRTLLVDDEDAILNLLSVILGRQHFSVRTATSAQAAIALLTEEHFDLVVTDLRMETPWAGFEVAKVAQETNPRPVVAILTAFPVPGRDWRATGADALFVKGSRPLELPTRLEELLLQHAVPAHAH